MKVFCDVRNDLAISLCQKGNLLWSQLRNRNKLKLIYE